MGAQANRLMPCVFQDRCFAPAGGAPADGPVPASSGACDLPSTPTGSAVHLVHDAFLLVPVGTAYHGTGKPDGVGTVQRVLPTIRTEAARTGNQP